MSDDLTTAIGLLEEAATQAENTADFFDDLTTGDSETDVTNPNNGITVPTVAKRVAEIAGDTQDAADAAQLSASEAAQSEVNAKASEDEASSYATSASSSATNAASSSSSASSSASSASTSASEAAGYAVESLNASNASIGAANYKGTWEGKTTAGVVGESYSYKNSFIYRLNVDLADISTSEPSTTNTDWIMIDAVPFEPPCKPTLSLDFANQTHTVYSKVDGFVTKPLADIVSQGRSTTGNATDAIGGITEFGTGVSRMTFDGDTGEALGYLSEESRTRLNTISALPTAAEDVVVTAKSYAISFYGDGEITLSGAYTETLTGTSSTERTVLIFTPTAGTLTITPSGTVENLQLEAGSFETSVILGEGSTITRGADSMTRTLGEEWNPNEGTLTGKFTISGFSDTGYSGGVGVGESTSNRLGFTVAEGHIRILIGTSYVDVSGGYSIGDTLNIVIAYSGTSYSIYINGELLRSNAGDYTLSSFLYIWTGFIGGNTTGRSSYETLKYYPRAFDSATLQRLSTL